MHENANRIMLGYQISEDTLKMNIARVESFTGSVGYSMLKSVAPESRENGEKLNLAGHSLQSTDKRRNAISHKTQCAASLLLTLYVRTLHLLTEYIN